MEPGMKTHALEYSTASGIRRIEQDRTHWRVSVETWPERDGYHGRFVFSPNGSHVPADMREGPDALRGSTREEVIAQAYELPEDRLKQVLRSLG
jgi:hypothetical protein